MKLKLLDDNISYIETEGFYKGEFIRPSNLTPIVLRYFMSSNQINICRDDAVKSEQAQILKRFKVSEFVNLIGSDTFMENGRIYTNALDLSNAKLPLGDLLPSDESLILFRDIKVCIPKFICENLQLQTNDITVIKILKDKYWLPSDIIERMKKVCDNSTEVRMVIVEILNKLDLSKDTSVLIEELIKIFKELCSSDMISKIFKELDYKELVRLEISSLQYNVIVISSWLNNPNSFLSLIRECRTYAKDYFTMLVLNNIKNNI